MIKKNNKTKISNRQKRLKIAIFIDHDIVIRHFIHSGAFLKLAENDVGEADMVCVYNLILI